MTYSRTVTGTPVGANSRSDVHSIRRKWQLGPDRSSAATLHPASGQRAPNRAKGPCVARDVTWLMPDGSAGFATVMTPKTAVIEAACANMARGTLISTEQGPIAVEDLTPGTRVLTSEYGPLPLQWVGSTTYQPHRNGGGEHAGGDSGKLFRVTADAFGLAKPSADLMLAPRAHILMRHAACQKLFGVDLAFAPIRAFEDGLQVVPINPISAVQLYNLAFDRQATILANGIELESFHPGPFAETLLDSELRNGLMRLFPQAITLSDFGPQLTQRLTSFEVRTLRDGA